MDQRLILEYHYDQDLLEALARYRAEQIRRARIKDMGTPADIQKLLQRMQRAQTLTDRAASEGGNAEAVMNNFEQTVNRFSENFGAMAEYDKQLAAMMQVSGNGGPPLQDTFPSPSIVPAAGGSAHLTPESSGIDHATGDPIRP